MYYEANLLRALYDADKTITRQGLEIERARACIARLRAANAALRAEREDMRMSAASKYSTMRQLPHKYGFRMALHAVGLSMPNSAITQSQGAER